MDKLSIIIQTGNWPEIIKPQVNLPKKSEKKVNALKSVCKNPLDFIEKFNPDFCAERYEIYNNETVALKSGMIKLSELKFAYEPDTAIDLISAWLVNASLYVRLEIDLHLIKDIARELYKEVFMFNIAEFNLFFSKLKRGHYGNLYGRFDGMTICNAAIEYRSKRGLILSKLPEEEQNKII